MYSKKLTTIPTLGKQWSVALAVKPAGPGAYNIIKLGERVLRINRNSISIFVNGKGEWQPVDLKPDDWTNIRVIQQVVERKVLVVILIDGRQVFCMENNNPMDFNNAPVHASFSGGKHTKGFIRNLIIETGKCSISSYSSKVQDKAQYI